MQELLRKSAMEQFNAIKDKKVSAVELTQASLNRINSIDEKLGAFNSLTEEIALETAKKVDEKVASSEELPLLAGVPLAFSGASPLPFALFVRRDTPLSLLKTTT